MPLRLPITRPTSPTHVITFLKQYELELRVSRREAEGPRSSQVRTLASHSEYTEATVTPLHGIMDIYEAIVMVIVVLVGGCFALITFLKSRLSVPGPGLRQYLPGGLVYPMYKDQRAVTKTLDTLSREYGDVYQMRFGPSVALVTAIPEDIVHIFSSIDLFPRAPALHTVFVAAAPGGILSMERELHKATKRALRDSFNYRMLESFHSPIVDAISELSDALISYVTEASRKETQPVVDITEELSITTFRVIANVAFGLGMNRQERLGLSENVNVFIEEIMKDFVGYPIRQALTPFGVRNQFIESERKVRKVCQDFVHKRLGETKGEKEGRRKDILDTILELKNIVTNSASSMAMEFAVAGSHSTNQSLAWCIFEICCNPQVVQRIDEELSLHIGDRPLSEPVTVGDMEKLRYFTSIWKETLRIHNIGAGVLRETQADVTLRGSGTFVPKGTRVMGHIARAQTHERIWKDALSFKPERWDSQEGLSEGDRVPGGCYVPFGVGPKACAGRFLADYEGPLVLVELYRRFRFRLACDPQEVVCCSCFVDTPKTSSKAGGPLDRGIPVLVSMK